MLRGREDDAEKIVRDIEGNVSQQKRELPKAEGEKLKLKARDHTPWKEIFQNMWRENRKRSLLALALMIGQSFFFNAVFFTYGLVINKFFKIGANQLPIHLLPFALGSFFGPIILGRLFDSVGRKPMIVATYGISGLLLVGTVPFMNGGLTLESVSQPLQSQT